VCGIYVVSQQRNLPDIPTMNEANVHPARSTGLLEKQWEAHRLLATRFAPGGKVELTAEQLQTLRALGYIR
jgi:hypothetical protein